MNAIICHGYGAPDRVLSISDLDEPEVEVHEVLVDVHAAAVNPADWHLIRGVPYLARLQIGLRRPSFNVPGSDFAGTVRSVSAAVTRLNVGDDVFGTTFMQGFGAFAERVAVSEELVVRKPPNVTHDEAAAVPLAALTALQGLRDHGHLQPGQKVLIIGASGGVGSFAVQIAKAFGADVSGVCSTKNIELVTSLGAGRVIDYTNPGSWDDIDRYDLILQAARERGLRPIAAALLQPTGTLVQISGESENQWFGPLGRIVAGRLLSSFVSQTITTCTVQPNRNDLELLAGLLDEGKVRPVIDATYQLEEFDGAIRHVEDGHSRGKVVLRLPTPADRGTA